MNDKCVTGGDDAAMQWGGCRKREKKSGVEIKLRGCLQEVVKAI